MFLTKRHGIYIIRRTIFNNFINKKIVNFFLKKEKRQKF